MNRPFLEPRRVRMAIATLSLFVATSCTNKEESPAPSAEKRQVPVRVETIELRDVPVEVRAVGTVEAFATVSVTAQVGGQLQKVHFKEGSRVRKGDVLFSLDRRPLEVTMAEARARRSRNDALLVNARTQLARYEELIKKEYVSQEEVDRARTEVEALEASIRADRGAVDAAALQLQYATIRSPIDGRTGAVLVHGGNVVRANDPNPLVVIRQDKPIHVRFSIPEQYLPTVRARMQAGQMPIVAIPKGHDVTVARGELSFVDNAVDTTTGTIKLKGLFPNDDELLWPGQYVEVTLRLDTDRAAIVAPRAAIQGGREGSFAFVVKPDNTVETRDVVIRRYQGDDAVVERGLAAGDKVVVDGQLQLSSGARVLIKQPAGATAASRPTLPDVQPAPPSGSGVPGNAAP